MRLYELAIPSQVAQAEWQEFSREDGLILGLGAVRFDAVAANRSRLAISGDDVALAVDAVVQRFRERLKRRGFV